MKRFKKIGTSILCMLMCSIVLCGCSITEFIAGFFQDDSVIPLEAPVVTLDEEQQKLSWLAIENATCYYVYCNDSTTPNKVSYSANSTYYFTFSSLLEDSGAYTFYVIASSTSSSYSDSEKSNTVTYNYIKLNKLDTPHVTINREAKTISWTAVENASGYEVYCNDTKIQTLNSTTTTYNFSEDVVAYNVYKFAVVAVGDMVEYNHSKVSRVVRYIHSDIEIYDVDADEYIYSGNTYNPNVTIDNTTISWNEIASADNYVVTVYNNDLEYLATDLDKTNTTFDISKLLFEDGVYVVRVGAKVDESVYMSNMLYYNTKSYGDYTANNHIYAFDGQVNDYYIEDYDELCNIAYYQFIKRNEDFNIRLSGHYVDEIIEDARYNSKSKVLDKVNLALEDAFSSFMETCYYNYGSGSTFATKLSTNDYEYRIRLDFYGVYECDTTIEPITIYEQFDYVPFYDTYVGTKRSNSYDSYESDDNFITTKVTTSEDLFWAVTYGYTPVFTSETCMAKVIYDKAKDVLQEIIYEEMTDFEKALAIFDWISLNTSYDHSQYNDYGTDDYDSSKEGYYFTEHACFYLEGVFITGNSVCDGFSKAFALMCNMEGIDCIRVVGSVSSGLHAWNKVYIDGKWYIVDITWTESDDVGEEVFFHSYFLVSDDFISRTHRDYEYRESYEKYPAENMYNYYENRYLGGYSNNALYDHLITSDEELETVLDYVMLNSLDGLEIMIDCTTYITPSSSSYTSVLETIYTKLRETKFASQYLHLVNWGAYVKYSDTSYGIPFTIDVTLLIDSIVDTATTLNEIDNIVDYAIENNLYGEYEIYVVKEILDDYKLDGYTLEQAFEAMVLDLNASGVEFNYTLTPKSNDAVEYSEGEYGYYFDIVINHAE